MQGVSFIRFMKQKYGIICVFVKTYPSQSSRVSVNPLIFMWYVAIMQYFENNTLKYIFDYRRTFLNIVNVFSVFCYYTRTCISLSKRALGRGPSPKDAIAELR